MARYSVSLPSTAEGDLNKIATSLQITKAEAFRRALTLYRHAVEAEKVTLTDKDGQNLAVLVK